MIKKQSFENYNDHYSMFKMFCKLYLIFMVGQTEYL